MTRTGSAFLKFDAKLDVPKKKMRDGLSAVLHIGNTLWVANDETVSLERLTYRGAQGDGVHSYGEHVQFPLHEYLRLPVPLPPDPKDIDEADVEGMDYRDGYLWLVGSHSLKRKKPDDDASAKKNAKRLAKVNRDGNRFLLARIPVVQENGSWTLKKAAALDGKRLFAARLHGDETGNDLMKALRQDKHLEPFLAIPGKDNGLDFEGVAVLGKRLFIGLRGPVLRGWAMILEVEPEEDAHDPPMLRLKVLEPGDTLYRKHYLQLAGMGIRDLCVQGDDLLILAGPTMDIDGPVRVFRWRGGALTKDESCVLFAKDLEGVLHVPCQEGQSEGTDRPEGITLFTPDEAGGTSLLVVYDSAAESRKRGADGVEADIFRI